MTKSIALDPGHGLYTAGKQTPTGIKEWSLNDIIGDKATVNLKDYDCNILRLDNNEGKVDESLSSRLSRYLSENVDAMVSLHHNALKSTWSGATGVEVYVDINATADDLKLAECIYTRLVKYTGLKGRGIKRANFYVINQNKIPAVLVEGGFMDGTDDYKYITSDEGQEAYAKAISDGLIEFLSLKKKKQSAPVTKAPATKISITYQVWDDTKNAWLPNVKDLEDYAGILGHNICGLRANLSKGNVFYKVHYKGGKWLPEVKNRTDYAGIFNKPIDGIMLKTDTGKKIYYAVHLRKQNRWLPYVTGYSTSDHNNGYAGILGQEIDAVKIYIK